MPYGTEYLHLDEEPDPEANVLCTFKVKSTIPIEKAASAIAAEQSTGTWTTVGTTDQEIFESYGGRVYRLDRWDDHSGMVDIAFPVEDFSIGIGGIPQVLSVIAGNLFGLEELTGARLEDVFFPESINRQFRGPRFGLRGLKEHLGMKPERPLVGTIVKPKIGLDPDRFAEYVYQGGLGGLTNSKDDETLSDQVFCPIEERTRKVAEAIDRVKDETGRKMLHAINISTRTDEIVELAEKAQEWGATQLMIDVLTCGFTSVQSVAEDPSIKLPLHIHRTMHGAMTRNEDIGISMTVISKLVRMCGGDALHIGTFGVGKMAGTPEEDMKYHNALVCDMGSLEHVMPVCSGGMHPGLIPALMKVVGSDIQIQAGGGVSGHPGGVMKGAMAMNQAIDSALAHMDIHEYAADHEELRLAVEKWGTA